MRTRRHSPVLAASARRVVRAYDQPRASRTRRRPSACSASAVRGRGGARAWRCRARGDKLRRRGRSPPHRCRSIRRCWRRVAARCARDTISACRSCWHRTRCTSPGLRWPTSCRNPSRPRRPRCLGRARWPRSLRRCGKEAWCRRPWCSKSSRLHHRADACGSAVRGPLGNGPFGRAGRRERRGSHTLRRSHRHGRRRCPSRGRSSRNGYSASKRPARRS